MKMDTSRVLKITLNVIRPGPSGKVCSRVLGNHRAKLWVSRGKKFRDQYGAQVACDLPHSGQVELLQRNTVLPEG